MGRNLPSVLSLALLTCFAALCEGCNEATIDHHTVRPPDNAPRVTIDQGIWGNVWFWEGDFMPSKPTGTITPVTREVLIYEETNVSDVDEVRPAFYANVATRLVATALSDASGFFEMELDPGRYSVFVKEGSLLYASISDTQGSIFPVAVAPGRAVKAQIDITYRATF